MESNDSRRSEFRNAMARMSAAVNIVTSNGAAGRCGITVTAVCSVSDSPPTVLVCLNRSSAMNQVFKTNGVLAVNVLAADQEEHARHFAGMTGVPMEQRFTEQHWGEGELALPVLKHALASLQGRITRADEVGSHTILIVEIDAISLRGEGSDSLVYFDRLFHSLPHQQAAVSHN